MAAPQKDNLSYFPFDVSFFSDKKIKRLRAKYGNDGVCLLIYLYTQIYAEGYYIAYDDDLILDVSDELNISENLTRQIIAYLFSRSLLNGTLAESVKVITAASIQRRYQEAKKGVKRDIVVRAEYWLLSPEETLSHIKVRPREGFSENNGSNSGNNGSNSENNSAKESKVNKSKGNDSKSIDSSDPGESDASESDAKRTVVQCAVQNSIDYLSLTADPKIDRTLIDELVMIITDVLCSERKTMIIGGEQYPMSTVKKRYRELNGEHIEFVLESMERTTSDIRNIRKYLIAALFNAPVKISSYYSARVRHDMKQ